MIMTAYAAPMTDRDSPVPLYVQVAALLRERIARDSLTRLPSLLSICQEYEVSRPTAEAAVRILVDAGEAYVVNGKGTFVARPPEG
jgi:GntR family transcriptional regulator